MTDIPYNQRCRIATPNYFREGIFRQRAPLVLPEDAVEIAVMASSRLISGNLAEAMPSRVASFLYYSAGHPSLQIYDLDLLTLNRSLVAVPTFDTDYEPASFPLYPLDPLEALAARIRLWWAGVKGPNSVISVTENHP